MRRCWEKTLLIFSCYGGISSKNETFSNGKNDNNDNDEKKDMLLSLVLFCCYFCFI